MADPAPHPADGEPVANHAYSQSRRPLTLDEQAFVLLIASTMFWTNNAADRAAVRDLCRETLPKVGRDHPYVGPIADLAERHLSPDTPRAQLGAINNELSGRVHDFLRWRGLAALAALQEQTEKAAQANGVAA